MAARRQRTSFETARAAIDGLAATIKSKPAFNFFFRFGLQPCDFNQIQINDIGSRNIAIESVDRMADYFIRQLNTAQPLLCDVAGLDYITNTNPFSYVPNAFFDAQARTYGDGGQFYQAMAHYSITNGMLQSIKKELADMKNYVGTIGLGSPFPPYLREYSNQTTVQWIDEIQTALITDSGIDHVNLPTPSGKQLTLSLGFLLHQNFYNDITQRIETTQDSLLASWQTLVRTVPNHWLKNMLDNGYIDMSIPLSTPQEVETFVTGDLKHLDIEAGVDGGMLLTWYFVVNPLSALNLQWDILDQNDIATIMAPAGQQAQQPPPGGGPPPPGGGAPPPGGGQPPGPGGQPQPVAIPLLHSLCKDGPGNWFDISDRELNKYLATISTIKFPDIPQPSATTTAVIAQIAESEVPCRMFLFQDWLRQVYYALPQQHRTSLFHRNYNITQAQYQQVMMIQEAAASRIVECITSSWAAQHRPNWMAKISIGPSSMTSPFKVFDLVSQICTAYIGPPGILAQGASLTQDILQASLQAREWPNESFVEWIKPMKIAHQMLEDFAPMTGQPGLTYPLNVVLTQISNRIYEPIRLKNKVKTTGDDSKKDLQLAYRSLLSNQNYTVTWEEIDALAQHHLMESAIYSAIGKPLTTQAYPGGPNVQPYGYAALASPAFTLVPGGTGGAAGGTGAPYMVPAHSPKRQKTGGKGGKGGKGGGGRGQTGGRSKGNGGRGHGHYGWPKGGKGGRGGKGGKGSPKGGKGSQARTPPTAGAGGASATTPTDDPWMEKIECWHCGEKGHMARNCPNRTEGENTANSASGGGQQDQQQGQEEEEIPWFNQHYSQHQNFGQGAGRR